MGAAQSRVRGIQRLHTVGLSDKTIATELKCSYTTIAEAANSTGSESPHIKFGRKKIITPGISCYMETLSLMDLFLTNDQIKAKVQERWPDLEVSCNTIREAQVNLGFKFRPPMIKRPVTQCHQFELEMLAKNFDPATITFIDECRFILGSDGGTGDMVSLPRPKGKRRPCPSKLGHCCV
jgi:hypothetical protein